MIGRSHPDGNTPPERSESTAPVPVSFRVATVGLVVVLLVLTAFSVTVAVANAQAAQQAERSAIASDEFELTLESLIAQEEAAEEFVGDGDRESRREYAQADSATRLALEELRRSVASDQIGRMDRLLRLHTRYDRAVQRMFLVAARSEDEAEHYEDAHVDPFFDPLSLALAADVKLLYSDARDSLTTIGRAQQFLLVTTPVLFGAGIALLVTFVALLGRSRRAVLMQASNNRHQSMHDALTGLPNRVLLRQRCEDALIQAHATGTPMAILLIDLDRFKEINDTLGHHHGDLVLQALAPLLRASIRTTDTVARLGGDEFAILLPQVSGVEGALEVALKLRAALETSIDVGGISLDIDASVGIVLSGEHGHDVEVLLQHADIAMYRAKDHDLGVCVYDAELNEHSREQLGLMGELRRALDNNELLLHFQPKITLASGDFCGAEALVRWNHPHRGLLGASSFIPAAEHTALISPLTLWVLNAALAECHQWRTQGRDLKLAVNVSARNLLETRFADDVLRLLADWQLPTSCLLLEVTESAVMLDPERAQSTLAKLAHVGIELAIDDFGAGYTSLAQLRTLPVSELKIDQTLISQMTSSPNGALIVGAVINLAHDLGIRTVAEGVESESTLAELWGMHCDIAQGFHVARPMTGTDLIQWSPEEWTPGQCPSTRAATSTRVAAS